MEKTTTNTDAPPSSPPSTGMDKEDLQLHVQKLELDPEQVKEGLLDKDFCTDEELTRFCKARKFEFKKVFKMIKEAIEWRRVAKPQNLRPDDVEDQSMTGKTYIAGKDKYGRPVIVMDSSCENSDSHQKKIVFSALQPRARQAHDGREPISPPSLIRCAVIADKLVDKWVLFIYLDKFSFFSSPPMKTSLETNRCLMLRYPERMGHCFLYQPPGLFSMVWKMASPLIDPRTKKKIQFMHGSFDKGSENDQKLTDILGDKWRALVGVDSKHSKQQARGYNHKDNWTTISSLYTDKGGEKSPQQEESVGGKEEEKQKAADNDGQLKKS
eukprot:jgi/Bigna1/91859/estExt_fgenesh1_pg.C_1250022